MHNAKCGIIEDARFMKMYCKSQGRAYHIERSGKNRSDHKKQGREKMEKRVITIESQTAAIKAQRLLTSNRIKARVIKLHPGKTERGCTHGVEVRTSDIFAATSLLRVNGIEYTGTVQL